MNKLGKLVDFNNDLITACRNNSRKAQIELYELFARRMYNTCLRIVKSRMLAEDVIQEAFISAFRSLDRFKGEVPFEAWLRRIVVNRSIDLLRQENKVFFEPVDELMIADKSNSVEENDEVKKEKLFTIIKEKLNELPNGYRVILSLFYLEGYDHEEISQILNINSSTSRSQLTRALKKLRETTNIKKMVNEVRQA
jgi:RNA polymerase sigma factor (sigma-70 family)